MLKVSLTISLSCSLAILCLSLLAPVYAQEPDSDAHPALKTLQHKPRKVSARFFENELLLNLPPNTVLATRRGTPLVYAGEFNRRLKATYGENLFQARYNALSKIIDAKLVAVVAREEGFAGDPMVMKRVAEAEIRSMQMPARKVPGDAEARQYYKKHIDQFKQPDRGTRVLFVVKEEHQAAQAILERIKRGASIDKFSFLSTQIPGSWLPEAVREAVFYLEPGQSTEVLKTPIGFYIAKLVERNAFDHFRVSIIVKNDLAQCQQVLNKIKAGEKFETLVAEKENLSMMLSDLPQEVQAVVPDMEPKELSHPINTPLGYFLVKLQERWSDAELITGLIKLNSENEGYEILSGLKNGLDIKRIKERKATSREISGKLLDAARRLKEGEYSKPVKTSFGYYLIKLKKRTRQMYKPFDTVKEEVKLLIEAERISDKTALAYYNANKAYYSKSAADYILDIILAETIAQGEEILAELKKLPAGKKQEALFAEHQKGLNSVSIEMLPATCQSVARKLQTGQLSPVITTRLGYFILRLREKIDPAYFPFEEVAYEIKSLLAEENKQWNESRAERLVTQAEERALFQAYRKANTIQNVATISDEAAEEWWRENKERFLNFLDIPKPESEAEEILFGSPQKTMRFKKVALLANRHNAMIQDLYIKNNVIIYENLLEQPY